MEQTTLNVALDRYVASLRPFLPDAPYSAILKAAASLTAMPESEKAEGGRFSGPLRRLTPLFSRLMGEEESNGAWVYPVRQVLPEALFPQTNTPDLEKETHREYDTLFKDLETDLGRLAHADPATLPLWFDHFDSLITRYLAAVPAATSNGTGDDISLCDHARIESAFAAADHLYDTLQTPAPDGKRYRIISGGISGIQSFIFQGYGRSRKYRSKLLRGRSFAVSLLTELAAVMLCQEIGLPAVSVILNAAGRFSILAPNTSGVDAALTRTDREINDWLMAGTYGETVIAFSDVTADKEDFEPGRMDALWEKMESAKKAKKFRRVDLDRQDDLIGDYLGQFDNNLAPPVCPLCGKRPAKADTAGDDYVNRENATCHLCRDHVFLGANLVKEDRLAVTDVRKASGGRRWNRLLSPLFDRFQIAFSTPAPDPEGLLKHWDLKRQPGGDIAAKSISGYVPKTEQPDIDLWNRSGMKAGEREEAPNIDDPMTLNIIALKAKTETKDENGNFRYQGIAALGVLKADVDDLGMLMGCGLGSGRFTLTRLATLSRQLNQFFAVDLPGFLAATPAYSDVYTVFAGGDDLFLIGPWKRIIELSLLLRSRFEDYVCRNKRVHFSAGITFHKPHTPVDRMADAAEMALEQSKHENPEKKDRLTLFSETVTWEKALELVEIRKTLEAWLDDEAETVNTAMLYRLNDLMEMAGKEVILQEAGIDRFEDMSCAKWRAYLAYTVARNVAGKLKRTPEKREKIIEKVVKEMTRWLKCHREKLKIAVWNILYDRR